MHAYVHTCIYGPSSQVQAAVARRRGSPKRDDQYRVMGKRPDNPVKSMVSG